ncbi:hypothetical protein, partial [Nocardiopsis sp. TNDT3]
TGSGYGGSGAIRATWRLRLLAGQPGALGRLGATAVPDSTSRRWSRGPYVRSATVTPLGSGDLQVTVADVHAWEAVRRRMP